MSDLKEALEAEKERAEKREDVPETLQKEYLEFIDETINFFLRKRN